MKSVIKRAVAISLRGIIKAVANIGSASIIHRSEIGNAVASIVLLSLVIIAVGDTALAQTTGAGTGEADTALTTGFTKLLTFIFGPIRWILSVIGILIGLWHIFVGMRPDSKRTGAIVITGVLAYAFAPTIVKFILTIAGNQSFSRSDINSINAP